MTTQDPNVIQSDANAELIAGILPKLQALDEALLAQAPTIRNHLQDINDNLREFPDLVHLLTDEQIRPIYSALRAHTNVEIAARASKAKGPKTSAADKQMLNDLL